jgi:type I restriction enzyme M protein
LALDLKAWHPILKGHPSYLMNKLNKAHESRIWDAACSIRGAKDAAKYKEFIFPLIFTKRLCDVFDEELNRIAKEVSCKMT